MSANTELNLEGRALLYPISSEMRQIIIDRLMNAVKYGSARLAQSAIGHLLRSDNLNLEYQKLNAQLQGEIENNIKIEVVYEKLPNQSPATISISTENNKLIEAPSTDSCIS